MKDQGSLFDARRRGFQHSLSITLTCHDTGTLQFLDSSVGTLENEK